MDQAKFNQKHEWRKFGFVFAGFLAAAGALNWFRGHDAFPVLWGLSAFTGAAAFLLPVLLKPVYIAFLFLGEWLGWLMTRVILTVLYFLILTPVSLISKLTGKRYLTTRPDPERSSYWEKPESSEGASHYNNQY